MPEEFDGEIGHIQANDAERVLRAIRPPRGRYTHDEVNFIREAYLVDRMTLQEINERLSMQSSKNSLWRIAVGRAYREVPLSARLREAVHAQIGDAVVTAKRASHSEPAAAPLPPVRAAELLGGEDDWS